MLGFKKMLHMVQCVLSSAESTGNTVTLCFIYIRSQKSEMGIIALNVFWLQIRKLVKFTNIVFHLYEEVRISERPLRSHISFYKGGLSLKAD